MATSLAASAIRAARSDVAMLAGTDGAIERLIAGWLAEQTFNTCRNTSSAALRSSAGVGAAWPCGSGRFGAVVDVRATSGCASFSVDRRGSDNHQGCAR